MVARFLGIAGMRNGALAAGMVALGRAVLVAAPPSARMVAWFHIIEDFVSWLQGKCSLFGDRFGDVETVGENIRKAFARAGVAQAARDMVADLGGGQAASPWRCRGLS